MKLGDGVAPDAVLAGPSVTEEVQSALLRLMEALRDLQQRHPVGARLDLAVLSHGNNADGRAVVLRRPFREFGRPRALYTHPPILHLSPAEVVPRLLDQYLFAVLHEIFYTSLMAEIAGASSIWTRRSNGWRRRPGT
jgi:F-type H+-transporting ATPase subunit gamma